MINGTPGLARTRARILIVGSSNAGKTTLGGLLASKLGLPFVELDALHWGPNWTPVADSTFLDRVEESLAESLDGWVVDGNYEGKLGDALWRTADTVVFLDLRLPVLVGRIIRRTIVRSLRRTRLYSDNRERLRYLVNRESLIWFTIRYYKAKRERFSQRAGSPEYSHLELVRLRSGREVNRWVASLDSRPRLR